MIFKLADIDLRICKNCAVLVYQSNSVAVFAEVVKVTDTLVFDRSCNERRFLLKLIFKLVLKNAVQYAHYQKNACKKNYHSRKK